MHRGDVQRWNAKVYELCAPFTNKAPGAKMISCNLSFNSKNSGTARQLWLRLSLTSKRQRVAECNGCHALLSVDGPITVGEAVPLGRAS